MHHAVKPLLAATLLAAAGLASANDGRTHDGNWLTDHVAVQGSFAAAVQADDALWPTQTAHDARAAATDSAAAPSPAYALTLAGLAMMGVLVRRRRRDTF